MVFKVSCIIRTYVHTVAYMQKQTRMFVYIYMCVCTLLRFCDLTAPVFLANACEGARLCPFPHCRGTGARPTVSVDFRAAHEEVAAASARLHLVMSVCRLSTATPLTAETQTLTCALVQVGWIFPASAFCLQSSQAGCRATAAFFRVHTFFHGRRPEL